MNRTEKTEAYVLITVQTGYLSSVLEALRGLEGVKRVDFVTGPYDIVALFERDDSDSLTEFVVRDMQSIQGITKTMTCLVLGPVS